MGNAVHIKQSFFFIDSGKEGFVADLVKYMKKLQPYGHAIFYAICRLITIHLYKVVYISAVYVITREVRTALQCVQLKVIL